MLGWRETLGAFEYGGSALAGIRFLGKYDFALMQVFAYFTSLQEKNEMTSVSVFVKRMPVVVRFMENDPKTKSFFFRKLYICFKKIYNIYKKRKTYLELRDACLDVSVSMATCILKFFIRFILAWP